MRLPRNRATGITLAGAAVILSIGAVAGPAHAAAYRTPAPKPTPVSSPAPAPAPAPIPVTGTVTKLGENFSAGGYLRVNYTVNIAVSGTYAVQYSTDVAGSAVNTFVDSTSLNQASVAAGTPVKTSTFVLSAGNHVIGTQSPDGYGNVTISLVRIG